MKKYTKIYILYMKYFNIKGNCDKLNIDDKPKATTEIPESVRYTHKKEKKRINISQFILKKIERVGQGNKEQMGKCITKQQENKFKYNYFNNDIKYKRLKHLKNNIHISILVKFLNKTLLNRIQTQQKRLYKEYKIKTNSIFFKRNSW